MKNRRILFKINVNNKTKLRYTRQKTVKMESTLQQWRIYAKKCSELTILTDIFFLTFTTTKRLNKK